jgi:hypothetical protein
MKAASAVSLKLARSDSASEGEHQGEHQRSKFVTMSRQRAQRSSFIVRLLVREAAAPSPNRSTSARNVFLKFHSAKRFVIFKEDIFLTLELGQCGKNMFLKNQHRCFLGSLVFQENICLALSQFQCETNITLKKENRFSQKLCRVGTNPVNQPRRPVLERRRAKERLRV